MSGSDVSNGGYREMMMDRRLGMVRRDSVFYSRESRRGKVRAGGLLEA